MYSNKSQERDYLLGGWLLNVEEHKGAFYKLLKVFSILIGVL